MEECHTVGVVSRAVQEEVLRSVWLCGAPGAEWGVSNAQSMEVGVETGVADSQSGNCSVQGSVGRVGPEVELGVRSEVPKSCVSHGVCQCPCPMSFAGSPQVCQKVCLVSR